MYLIRKIKDCVKDIFMILRHIFVILNKHISNSSSFLCTQVTMIHINIYIGIYMNSQYIHRPCT